MIHQLSTIPFDKYAAFAMLNTLFPPHIDNLPNGRVLKPVMYRYRSTFYRHILAIAVNGPTIFLKFAKTHFGAGRAHNWFATGSAMVNYLALANSMIVQAHEVCSGNVFPRRCGNASGAADYHRDSSGTTANSSSTTLSRYSNAYALHDFARDRTSELFGGEPRLGRAHTHGSSSSFSRPSTPVDPISAFTNKVASSELQLPELLIKKKSHGLFAKKDVESIDPLDKEITRVKRQLGILKTPKTLQSSATLTSLNNTSNKITPPALRKKASFGGIMRKQSTAENLPEMARPVLRTRSSLQDVLRKSPALESLHVEPRGSSHLSYSQDLEENSPAVPSADGQPIFQRQATLQNVFLAPPEAKYDSHVRQRSKLASPGDRPAYMPMSKFAKPMGRTPTFESTGRRTESLGKSVGIANLARQSSTELTQLLEMNSSVSLSPIAPLYTGGLALKAVERSTLTTADIGERYPRESPVDARHSKNFLVNDQIRSFYLQKAHAKKRGLPPPDEPVTATPMAGTTRVFSPTMTTMLSPFRRKKKAKSEVAH